MRGNVSYHMSSLSDPVLIREDGRVIYTLASVVDDIDHGITTILRGEDHVTNSAAQIQLFEALGAQPPAMGHLPCWQVQMERGCQNAWAVCLFANCARKGGSTGPCQSVSANWHISTDHSAALNGRYYCRV